MIRAMIIAACVLVTSWALLAALAARLPPGLLKESLGFLPNCVTFLRRLGRDPRVPRGVKIALAGTALWVASPIDLLPEFLPVIGPLDDVVVVILVLRYAAKRVPREALVEAWPGDPRVLARLLRTRSGTPRGRQPTEDAGEQR